MTTHFSGVRAGVLALSIVLSLVVSGGSARAQQLPTVRVIALPIDSGSQPFIAQPCT